MPFLDLDANIEAHVGMPITSIMRARGEETFRDLESLALKDSINQPAQVIALGGGALLREGNRALAEAHGQIIFLETDPAVLIERLKQDKNQRPLLAGELESSLRSLLREREDHYGSFPLRVNTEMEPERILALIRTLLGRHRLRAMGAPYDVLVAEGGLDDIGNLLTSRGCNGPVLLVSDEHVAPLYAGRVQEALSRPVLRTNCSSSRPGKNTRQLRPSHVCGGRFGGWVGSQEYHAGFGGRGWSAT